VAYFYINKINKNGNKITIQCHPYYVAAKLIFIKTNNKNGNKTNMASLFLAFHVHPKSFDEHALVCVCAPPYHSPSELPLYKL
jgi:hypothetical protein